jgi:hypothetical protein
MQHVTNTKKMTVRRNMLCVTEWYTSRESRLATWIRRAARPFAHSPSTTFNTMDLRRLAQANAMASPTRRLSHQSTTTNYATTSPPSVPSTTPKTRASYPITRSPLESPSISASLPFDWEAARGLRSPPYSPLGPKRRGARKSGIDSPNGNAAATKRAVRKKGLYER